METRIVPVDRDSNNRRHKQALTSLSPADRLVSRAVFYPKSVFFPPRPHRNPSLRPPEEIVAMSSSWSRALTQISPYTFASIGIAISIGVSVLGAAW
ncbi:hypothetical protein B296_00026847 [Ensete ventricosum]|uniref:V-ATPase proteolipid subunit C-like domain-containing protein n=1 Tax=Ensete ventricosum TaxID=4639 RepID=A0A426ZYA3_ENSVE|nr:hypothetical protein B296_00026847 [Ensete ventricosum]